jgi:streptogramin lyase
MKKVTLLALLALLVLSFSRCKKNSNDKPKKVIVTTIAGTGEPGYLDATAAFAKFANPMDVAVHTDGTLYITDFFNRRIRKLTPQGLVLTHSGSGIAGNVNGTASMARFLELSLIVMDAPGNAYVLDGSIPQVRKITPGGDVSVFAGSGTYDYADGRIDSAHFKQGWGLTLDNKGNIYVADTYNDRIRKIANGYVTTVAGNGIAGYKDGDAAQAQFNKPHGIAVDKQGNLYVADEKNYRIRKITPAGTVSTFAGTGTQGVADGGTGTAQFYVIGDMVIDNKGILYVTDVHRIRKITPGGEVSTIAGSQTPGFADGEGNQAQFQFAAGLGIDAAGNIYVADGANHRIRKISFQ